MNFARSIAVFGLTLTACARTPEPVPQAYVGPPPTAALVYAPPAPPPPTPPPPPAPPPSPNFGAKSLLLKIGMGEHEVTRVLGAPLKAEVRTCGTKTPKPWTCKTWTYGNWSSGMMVTFSEASGEWLLNDWSVN
jgi:hypothetical protein